MFAALVHWSGRFCVWHFFCRGLFHLLFVTTQTSVPPAPSGTRSGEGTVTFILAQTRSYPLKKTHAVDFDNVILSAMNSAAYSTWLEIDLSAIRQNVGELCRITGVTVMAVVKANGYGHGMVEVGRAALQGGAGWLAVARIEEALALRSAGIRQPILVLGYTAAERSGEAALNDIRLAVFDAELAAAYAAEALRLGTHLRVHAKFDSGMGRWAFSLRTACLLCALWRSCRGWWWKARLRILPAPMNRRQKRPIGS